MTNNADGQSIKMKKSKRKRKKNVRGRSGGG